MHGRSIIWLELAGDSAYVKNKNRLCSKDIYIYEYRKKIGKKKRKIEQKGGKTEKKDMNYHLPGIFKSKF